MRLELTTGQAGDAPVATWLLDNVAAGATVIADKAYDTDGIRSRRELLQPHEANPWLGYLM